MGSEWTAGSWQQRAEWCAREQHYQHIVIAVTVLRFGEKFEVNFETRSETCILCTD